MRLYIPIPLEFVFLLRKLMEKIFLGRLLNSLSLKSEIFPMSVVPLRLINSGELIFYERGVLAFNQNQFTYKVNLN